MTTKSATSSSSTINSFSSTDEVSLNSTSFVVNSTRGSAINNSSDNSAKPQPQLRNAKRSPQAVITNSTTINSTTNSTINGITMPNRVDSSSTINSSSNKPHQPKKKMKNGHHHHHNNHHHQNHRHLLHPSVLRRTNSMTDEEFEEFVEEEEVEVTPKSAIKIVNEEDEEEDKDSVVETTTSEDEEDFEKNGSKLLSTQERRIPPPPICYNGRHCLDCESNLGVGGGKFGDHLLLQDEDNTSDLTSSPPPPISSPSSSYSVSSSADSSPSSSSLNPLQTLTKIGQQKQKVPNSSNSATAKSLETVLIDAVFEAASKTTSTSSISSPPTSLPEKADSGIQNGNSDVVNDHLGGSTCCRLCCPDPEVSLETTTSTTTISNFYSSPPPFSNSHLLPYYPPTVSSIREAVSHLTRLDDFNVVKLSHGFFSQVFKVVHFSTKKVMVLKMNKEAGNRGNALKEIELLNKLNHENIVAYMGTVVHEGALHPLLEFINGGTLEQLIRPFYTCSEVTGELSAPSPQEPSQSLYYHPHYHQHLPSSSSLIISPKVHRLRDPDWTFLKLMRDVAAGMEYLHACGYLHRDLASKNVFIRKRAPNQSEVDGSMIIRRSTTTTEDHYDWFDDHRLVAVIGDFGFATTEPTPDQKLSTVGSPYWLAPECFKNQWYNHRCDIYSFGVVCCELNWRVPADPDFLPRLEHNFAVDFGKLDCRGRRGTALGKVAQMACSIDPAARPEFSTILDLFDFELNKRLNGMKKMEKDEEKFNSSDLPHHHLESKMVNLEKVDVVDGSGGKITCPPATFKRGFSLDSSMLQSVQLQQQKQEEEVKRPLKSVDESDIFEQHLLRRRYSSALAKASTGTSDHHQVCNHHHLHSSFHHNLHPHHNHLHQNFSNPLPDVRKCSVTEGRGGGNEEVDARRNL